MSATEDTYRELAEAHPWIVAAHHVTLSIETLEDGAKVVTGAWVAVDAAADVRAPVPYHWGRGDRFDKGRDETVVFFSGLEARLWADPPSYDPECHNVEKWLVEALAAKVAAR